MLPVDPQAGFNFFNATCGSTGRMVGVVQKSKQVQLRMVQKSTL
jgi:hypothetical protein